MSQVYELWKTNMATLEAIGNEHSKKLNYNYIYKFKDIIIINNIWQRKVKEKIKKLVL